MEFASDKAFLQSKKIQPCIEKLVYLCILIKMERIYGLFISKVFIKNNCLLFVNSL